MILADTSAWIGYLRGDGTPAALRLRHLIDRGEGTLVSTGPVEMEVLVGARRVAGVMGITMDEGSLRA